MSNPSDLKYTESHEWVRDNGDGTATVGITHHAQEALGELVYVELPDAHRNVKANDACAVVESTKAASDVYAPIDGEIVSVNEALPNEPQLVNEAPFGEGWLFKIRIADPAQLQRLMSSADYDKSIGA
ncbi:MAG TPA: glycine cleavage system protein GcvH [Burkholderiaceae bacterium]|nr:glycine cleavage system protein GcvH [Burkholderiaceae bacterium]